MSNEQNQNPDMKKSGLSQYVELLCQLHTLMSEGRDDSPESDALRDAMDAPWYKLTIEETKRVGGLSADLYSLEKAKFASVDSTEQNSLVRDLWTAFVKRDWDVLLELIRKYETVLPLSPVTNLRAHVWFHLGESAPTKLFLQGAASLAIQECIEALQAQKIAPCSDGNPSTTNESGDLAAKRALYERRQARDLCGLMNIYKP
jgi:hypothetical protein